MSARLLVTIRACSLALAVQIAAPAQQSGITIDQAVRQSVADYPAATAALAQASAAAAAVNLARTSYLPRADFVAQANRATRNNVFGMVLPQSTLPAISGPVLGTNSSGSAWGSAAGFQVAWEPIDFGLRRASVEAAVAGRRRAETGVERARFEIGGSAADAFLTVVAAEQTAVAAQAGVKRSRVLLEIVDSLVKAELRPGADQSRARAELAIAENLMIQAQQSIEVSKAALGQFLGRRRDDISVSAGPLLGAPPGVALTEVAKAEHPRLVEQAAAVEQARANQRVLDRSYYPRFSLQAVSYGRGTGALTNGDLAGGLSGMGPNIFNWGVGLTVTFPALDVASIKARKEIEQYRERAEVARRELVRREINAEAERAMAQLEGAARIARNTPVLLEAARATEEQAAARYRAGLGTLVEVAEAQRLVTQAEIDDSLARLNIWRGALRLAIARGDLEPFLRQASR